MGDGPGHSLVDPPVPEELGTALTEETGGDQSFKLLDDPAPFRARRVVNIREYARASVRPAPVHAILGGLHLFPADEASLDWTADRLKAMGVGHLLGAHCTGVEAVYTLRTKLGLDRRTCVVGAVGSGFDLKNGILPGTIAR